MDQSASKKGDARFIAASAPWRELIILACLGAFLFFYGLGSFGLVGADEPRYAQIAREMLQRRDWVVPVLNGTPWLEKPVLLYWEEMLSYGIFGVHDWAARLPNACNALVMVFAIYLFVRRFRKGLQLDAVLLTASSIAMIGYARAASTDMPLLAMFTIAMLSWAMWYTSQQRKWLALFYVFLGLAILAKGPVAPFLAALIIVPFALIRRDLKVIRNTIWITGILLFIAVALPWYVMVQSRVPEFFRIFILEHNLARYGSNLYRHHQPFWYYIPVTLAALLPWTVLAFTGLVYGIRQVIAGLNSKEESQEPRGGLVLFFVLWAVLPIIFFSFSGSKLPGYILPTVPGFVMLTVEWLSHREGAGRRLNPLLVVGHAIVANLVLTAALLCYYIIYRMKPTVQAYEVAGILTGFVLVVSIVLLLLRGFRMLRLVTLIPVVIGIGFVLKVASPAIDAAQSARPVAQMIENAAKPSLPIAGFEIKRELEYGLTFYLNRPVSIYDRAEIPTGEHIVVVRKTSEAELASLVPGRRITRLREFEPQNVDVCLVEAAR